MQLNYRDSSSPRREDPGAAHEEQGRPRGGPAFHLKMHICIYTHICIYVCMYVCMHVYIYIYIYIYMTTTTTNNNNENNNDNSNSNTNIIYIILLISEFGLKRIALRLISGPWRSSRGTRPPSPRRPGRGRVPTDRQTTRTHNNINIQITSA